MISRSQIVALRDRWQATEQNVAREYVQHVLLASLHAAPRARAGLVFKGGTALRILHGSPRFSEDLDFTGWGTPYHVGRLVEATVREAEMAGLEFARETSEATSGGWFAAVTTRIHDWPVRVEWNVSLRKGRGGRRETVLVTTPLWTPYSIEALPVETMVFEKVDALLRRGKPRDFFDLYFVLRERLGIDEIVRRRAKLLDRVVRLNARTLARDLREFLSRTHWTLLKGLPALLRRELERL